MEQTLAEADRRFAAPFDGSTVGGQSLFTAFVQLGLAWHWTGDEHPYRVQAAGFLLSSVNPGQSLSAHFYGANDRLLSTLTGIGTAESYSSEAAGSELFFGYKAPTDNPDDWIHRIELAGSNNGNLGFDEFCFTPITAGHAHPWTSLPASPDSAWRFTNLGPVHVTAFPWVFNPALQSWLYFLPSSSPSSQFAFLLNQSSWIFSANHLGPYYYDYRSAQWQFLPL